MIFELIILFIMGLRTLEFIEKWLWELAGLKYPRDLGDFFPRR